MALCDFSVQNANVLCFNSLTDVEKLKVVGSPDLYHTVNASLSCAGAAASVFVLRGIFGEEIVGRFEQLVSIIGGSVIGFGAGCIVFMISGYVVVGFVVAFVLGALAGGVICVMTANRKKILGSLRNLWTAAMEKIKGFATVVVEAVQNALAKTVKVMASAYSTICEQLDRVGQALENMSKEQKAEVLTEVETGVVEFEISIKQAGNEFTKTMGRILAPFDKKKKVTKDVTEMVQSTQDINSEVIKQKIESLKSDKPSNEIINAKEGRTSVLRNLTSKTSADDDATLMHILADATQTQENVMAELGITSFFNEPSQTELEDEISNILRRNTLGSSNEDSDTERVLHEILNETGEDRGITEMLDDLRLPDVPSSPPSEKKTKKTSE